MPSTGLVCKAGRRAAKPAGVGLRDHAGDELSVHRKVQTHQVKPARKKIKVLTLFDAMGPPPPDLDLGAELKKEDRKTERNVLDALTKLGHNAEHLVIFDDLDS